MARGYGWLQVKRAAHAALALLVAKTAMSRVFSALVVTSLSF